MGLVMPMQRRDFLKLGAGSSLALGFGGRLNAAESDTRALYAKFVPHDKQLDGAWVESLALRGHLLDAAIEHDSAGVDPEIIGMTVGGIGCGTVYLSGDGRLWVWDIFNQHHEGVVPNQVPAPEGTGNIHGAKKVRERDGANFLKPPRASEHRNGVDARFTLHHGHTSLPLDASGWNKVRFTGRWPVGIVEYASDKTPLTVRLEAFSPFIPLRLQDSALPLTVLEYTVVNPTPDPIEVGLTGHLNNPAGQFSKQEAHRTTATFGSSEHRGLVHSLDESADAGAADAGSMAIAVFSGGGNADAAKNTVTGNATIAPGGSAKIRFVIAWHFPNLDTKRIGVPNVKRHYAKDFANARDVVEHFASNGERLVRETRDWVDCWNDSSLPQWLLDRTILTANTLQTQNCLLFDNGRFWAWEGVGCCPGTCGHVWEYAQGHARLFPEIERNLREVTDYKLALNRDGSIRFRGTNAGTVAIDAQCGYVLRTLRDHQLSDDPDYLKRVWEPAKSAIRYLVEFDKKGGLDGLLDGKQHNTLDAEWYGKVHVLCSMYLAALRAGEELAVAMEDQALAAELRSIHQMGRGNIASLFDGEYYIQIEDPAHADAIGVGTGCYIDQVMGQFWANQLGLGRLYDETHQKSALRALWKYNFVPEYGAFRQGFKEGRHYASKGDSGLLMCTWPKGGLRDDFKKHWQYAYFNEFMTGFEYQAAAHMVTERDADLVEHGLAITRAIHDRYSANRGRNPYNEIECSDHYARAGSSFAVFLAACGFQYDQSKRLLAFDPVVRAPDGSFKAPFLTSSAWGTYQESDGTASLRIAWGTLDLDKLDLAVFLGKEAKATLNGREISLNNLTLRKGDQLVLELS